jgi:hypothetical protein
VPDVAIQMHVVRASGLDVRQAEVMHLDSRAPRDSSEELVRRGVTAAVEAFLPSVPAHLRRMNDALAGGLPPPDPVTRCSDPYECPFEARCRVEEPRA